METPRPVTVQQSSPSPGVGQAGVGRRHALGRGIFLIVFRPCSAALRPANRTSSPAISEYLGCAKHSHGQATHDPRTLRGDADSREGHCPLVGAGPLARPARSSLSTHHQTSKTAPTTAPVDVEVVLDLIPWIASDLSEIDRSVMNGTRWSLPRINARLI